MNQNIAQASQAAAPGVENFLIAVVVFTAIAMLALNYPKVGKPLALFVLLALAGKALGAFE